VERPERERFYANVPPGSVLNLLLFGNPIPALTLLIRRDALNQIGGFQQSFNLPLVDLPTLLELSKLGEFCFDPATLGKWRVFGDQITKTYPVDILKNRAALSVHFLQNLDGETRKTLDLAECDLSSHFDSELQIAYARSGRYRLLRRDFRGARKDYLRAVFYRGPGNPAWRLRSIVGFVCSLFKKDVESLARALGKRTYQS
jgi:hypothetical protein